MLGIGGIGMSALARFFLHEGKRVAGYDRTPSPLTAALEAEGAAIHYTDDVTCIPAGFRDRERTLAVYTPAVHDDHSELTWLREQGFRVIKRSQMLGILAEGKYVMAVAGTHGKTTTTTLVAWLNSRMADGSAFLGGISRNFGSNLVLGGGRRLAVEADEFDRSFLRLHPDVAVVTSADADHLDIYGTHAAVREAFAQFVRQIRPGGDLVIRQGVDIALDNPAIGVWRYAYDEPCDFYARNIRLTANGHYRFDLVVPDGVIADCTLGVPGWVNIENAVAAVATLWCAARREARPLDGERLREAMASFEGVKRRFEFYVNTPRQVYMDDYAHHPTEIRATLEAAKSYPHKETWCIFQPHTYSRTKAFFHEFVDALSLADHVVLADIYAARETDTLGMSSRLLVDELSAKGCDAHYFPSFEEIETFILKKCKKDDLLITMGAGDVVNIGESLLNC